jgi:hypothetical protein
MQNRSIKIWLVVINLLLFGLTFTPVLAQVMEVEIIGGGYRLRGPDTITFPNVTASFEAQESMRDIRDLHEQNEEDPTSTTASDYVLIEDQNGGNIFDITVSATNLTSEGKTIPNSDFYIKNSNGTGNGIIANNTYSKLTGVALHPDTKDFASLNIERTLFNSDGAAPGAWKIFPVFKIIVPAETAPGTYVSTLTFTVI